MKNNNKLWIMIGIILLIILILKPSIKKEAGEIVKFRTSSLNYGPGSIIAFSLNCSGAELEQHQYSMDTVGGDYCSAYGAPLIENLPGSNSQSCIGSPSLHLFYDYYWVCCPTNDHGGTKYVLYTKAVLGTEQSASIDSSRELNCILPPSPYGTFLLSKNNYLNGGLLSAFITAANSWITST